MQIVNKDTYIALDCLLSLTTIKGSRFEFGSSMWQVTSELKLFGEFSLYPWSLYVHHFNHPSLLNDNAIQCESDVYVKNITFIIPYNVIYSFLSLGTKLIMDFR